MFSWDLQKGDSCVHFLHTEGQLEENTHQQHFFTQESSCLFWYFEDLLQ